MNIDEARTYVEDRLGASWRLAKVTARLVPGSAVGEPTRQSVEVVLDYHPGGRSEVQSWVTGPHLIFEGTAGTIEDAISVATGEGLSHETVQRYGSSIPHASEASRD